MFGGIEYADFSNVKQDLPEKVASANSAIESNDLVGASYKPILFIGAQVVKGVNYWFLAEQTLVLSRPIKKLVLVAVNEFGGKYKISKIVINIFESIAG